MLFDKKYLVVCSRNHVVINSFSTIIECECYIRSIAHCFNIPIGSMYITRSSDYVSK